MLFLRRSLHRWQVILLHNLLPLLTEATISTAVRLSLAAIALKANGGLVAGRRGNIWFPQCVWGAEGNLPETILWLPCHGLWFPHLPETILWLPCHGLWFPHLPETILWLPCHGLWFPHLPETILWVPCHGLWFPHLPETILWVPCHGLWFPLPSPPKPACLTLDLWPHQSPLICPLSSISFLCFCEGRQSSRVLQHGNPKTSFS